MAALQQLRELSEKVGTAFMASVSRPPVERCLVRFGFKCPLKWEALQRTAREEVRHCVGCRQDVQFVRTLKEAQAIARRGGPRLFPLRNVREKPRLRRRYRRGGLLRCPLRDGNSSSPRSRETSLPRSQNGDQSNEPNQDPRPRRRRQQLRPPEHLRSAA